MKQISLCMVLLVSAVICPFDAMAQWGTPDKPTVLTSSTNYAYEDMKTARTSDGKTYVSWIDYSDKDGWGFNMYLQLLDADGVPMWDEPMEVENFRNSSWCSAYYIVATPEGDAVISWEDARYDLESDYPEQHGSAIYKVSQEGKHLWGEEGLYFGGKYAFAPVLYMFGDDLYALFYVDSDDTRGYDRQLVRLDKDGNFAIEPVDFYGQLVASEGTDFICIYSGTTDTEAMRYTRDIKPVWEKPAVVSSYQCHNITVENNLYRCESDGHGGVVIAFEREFGMFGQMPVVQYVTADGEAVFGESVDVLATEQGVHSYSILGVNPESETIMTAWQITQDGTALGGQLMDFYGERLWGDNAKHLAEKNDETGYSYGTICIEPLKNDQWLVCFAEEIGWNRNQGYIGIYDAEGNEVSCTPFGGVCALNSPDVYKVDDSLIIIYRDESIDDDWNTTSSICTVKIDDLPFVSTGICNPAVVRPEGATQYYSVDGTRHAAPCKGINIVRKADGTTQKVVFKK